MEDSGLGRRSAPIAVLLCALVLLASAERRLAYVDFDTSGDVRIENNEKPDGDEIINRLVFVGDATEPILPGVGEACRAALASLPACWRPSPSRSTPTCRRVRGLPMPRPVPARSCRPSRSTAPTWATCPPAWPTSR